MCFIFRFLKRPQTAPRATKDNAINTLRTHLALTSASLRYLLAICFANRRRVNVGFPIKFDLVCGHETEPQEAPPASCYRETAATQSQQRTGFAGTWATPLVIRRDFGHLQNKRSTCTVLSRNSSTRPARNWLRQSVGYAISNTHGLGTSATSSLEVPHHSPYRGPNLGRNRGRLRKRKIKHVKPIADARY